MNDIISNKKIKVSNETEYDMLIDFAMNMGYTFKGSRSKPKYNSEMYAFFIYGDTKKISYMMNGGEDSSYFNEHRLEEMQVSEVIGKDNGVVKALLEENKSLKESLNYITVFAKNLLQIADSMPTAATDDFSDEHIAAWDVHNKFLEDFGNDKALKLFQKYDTTKNIPRRVEQVG